MVWWHYQLNGHESELSPGDGEGQGSMVCCSPWDRKESAQLSNWTTQSSWGHIHTFPSLSTAGSRPVPSSLKFSLLWDFSFFCWIHTLLEVGAGLMNNSRPALHTQYGVWVLEEAGGGWGLRPWGMSINLAPKRVSTLLTHPVQGGFSASYTGIVTPAALQPDVPQQFQKEITIHVIKGNDHELVSLFFFYLTQWKYNYILYVKSHAY